MHQPLHTPAPHSNIIALHYGPINNPDGNTQTERPIALGALDILEPDALAAQTPHRYAFNKPAPEPHSFEPESQDLILLNPPFNRHPEHKDIDLNIPDASAGIAATTPEELDRITKQYKQPRQDPRRSLRHRTGAHLHHHSPPAPVKPGGTIALLLPSTILSSMGPHQEHHTQGLEPRQTPTPRGIQRTSQSSQSRSLRCHRLILLPEHRHCRRHADRP